MGTLAFGRDVVDARKLEDEADGADAASCFARDAAVGAVRCEGRLTGFVVSRFFVVEMGDVLGWPGFSGTPDLASEAAVGAVRELLLAFVASDLVGAGPSGARGVLGCCEGDLTVFKVDLAAAFVVIGAGLPPPLVLTGPFAFLLPLSSLPVTAA